MRSTETAETAMKSNGDGSEGNSPSRQGAETETSVPQKLVFDGGGAAELFHGTENWTIPFRVFRPRRALYSRKGRSSGGGPGFPHHLGGRG